MWHSTNSPWKFQTQSKQCTRTTTLSQNCHSTKPEYFLPFQYGSQTCSSHTSTMRLYFITTPVSTIEPVQLMWWAGFCSDQRWLGIIQWNIFILLLFVKKYPFQWNCHKESLSNPKSRPTPLQNSQYHGGYGTNLECRRPKTKSLLWFRQSREVNTRHMSGKCPNHQAVIWCLFLWIFTLMRNGTKCWNL